MPSRPSCAQHSAPLTPFPQSSAFVLPRGSLLGPPTQGQAALGPSQWREGSLTRKGSQSDQVPLVRVASLTSIIFFFWHIAGEQEAGTAGHSPGPVVLVLLTTGKGVGLVAGLCAGEEKKEGASGAGRTGLPAAAPPGGCHTPFTVRGWHEGPPAAAACPAAGAGGSQSPPCGPSLCHALETEGSGPGQGDSSYHIHHAQEESDI